MNAPRTSSLARLRELDRRRHSWPGEHWIAFAAGLYLLQRSRPTRLGRLASVATGVAGRGGAGEDEGGRGARQGIHETVSFVEVMNGGRCRPAAGPARFFEAWALRAICRST